MDLNKDIETPMVHCKLGDTAINKICWTEDGKRITLGDSNGVIKLFPLMSLFNTGSFSKTRSITCFV